MEEITETGELIKFRIIDAKVDQIKLRDFFNKKVVEKE